MSSFDNVPVSLFLRDARTDMLPIRMWQDLEGKLDVTIAAVSGVLIVFDDRADDRDGAGGGAVEEVALTPPEQRKPPGRELERQMIMLRGVRDGEAERHQVEERRRGRRRAGRAQIVADMEHTS